MARRATSVLFLVASVVASAPAAGQSLSDRLKADAGRCLDRLQETGDFTAAKSELDGVFDQVVAYADVRDASVFLEVALARRITHQLEKAPAPTRRDLLAYLRREPALGATLVMLIRPEDDPAQVYALLNDLRQRYDDVPAYASLAAALCVVRDQPQDTRVNENVSDPADPSDVFEFYRKNESRMAFGIRPMPAELLVCVVDLPVSIGEASWALDRYAGRLDVGHRYGEIRYDYDHFENRTPKKITQAGFTLPNIAKFGGVCADQAHFAAAVGRSIGVPCAWVYGRNAENAHAWVAYLEAGGRHDAPRWNFDSGRYEGYRGVRGLVRDPQTGERVPDSALAIAAEAIGAPRAARHEAAAFVDAAARAGQRTGEPPPAPSADAPAPRAPGVATQLALLEAGLRRAPWYTPGWALLREIAASGALSTPDKKRWAGVLTSLCGDKYPDFTLDILIPMARTVEDPRDQDEIWESLLAGVRRRPDLVAEVRFNQARAWQKRGERARAWECYRDVALRFADEGPFAADALAQCSAMLFNHGKDAGEALPLCEEVWSRTRKPTRGAPEFTAASNWFQVGSHYAEMLESAGREGQAAQVRKRLGIKD